MHPQQLLHKAIHSDNLLSFQEFSEFYLCRYRDTMQQAYGTLTGIEASERLQSESQGSYTSERLKRDYASLQLAHPAAVLLPHKDIGSDIRLALLLHRFAHLSRSCINEALLDVDTKKSSPWDSCTRTALTLRNFVLERTRSLVTVAQTDDGAIVVSLNLTPQQRRWFHRFWQTALLSGVFARGKPRPTALMFVMLTVLWVLRQSVTLFARRYVRQANVVERSEPTEPVDTDAACVEEIDENAEEAPNDSIVARFVYPLADFVLRVIAVLRLFVVSLSPQWSQV